MLSHPNGTIAALIASALIVIAGGGVTWRLLRLTPTAPRRTFARFTIATFGALAAWLILIPILFRIFHLPGSVGPVQYTCGDPVALWVFHARGLTVLVTFASILTSPFLAHAVVVRMRLGPSPAPIIVGGLWAFGVVTRFSDLGFWPTA